MAVFDLLEPTTPAHSRPGGGHRGWRVVLGGLAVAVVLAGCGGSGTVTVGSGGVVVSADGGVVSAGPGGVSASAPGGGAVVGGGELPEGWPADFPLPDGFTPTISTVTADRLTVTGTVPSYDAAVAFFEANLTGPYAVSETVQAGPATTFRLVNGGLVIVRSSPPVGVDISLPS